MQGALRTAQDLYPFQIIHLRKRYVRSHNRVVPIRIHRGSGARLRIHADPAHGDNIVTGIGTGKRQSSGLLLNRTEVKRLVLLNVLSGDHVNRGSNILYIF